MNNYPSFFVFPAPNLVNIVLLLQFHHANLVLMAIPFLEVFANQLALKLFTKMLLNVYPVLILV